MAVTEQGPSLFSSGPVHGQGPSRPLPPAQAEGASSGPRSVTWPVGAGPFTTSIWDLSDLPSTLAVAGRGVLHPPGLCNPDAEAVGLAAPCDKCQAAVVPDPVPEEMQSPASELHRAALGQWRFYVVG